MRRRDPLKLSLGVLVGLPLAGGVYVTLELQ